MSAITKIIFDAAVILFVLLVINFAANGVLALVVAVLYAESGKMGKVGRRDFSQPKRMTIAERTQFSLWWCSGPYAFIFRKLKFRLDVFIFRIKRRLPGHAFGEPVLEQDNLIAQKRDMVGPNSGGTVLGGQLPQ